MPSRVDRPERCVVTGAGGFVGRALTRSIPGCTGLRLGVDDWRERIARAPLAGAILFHLAARVHDPRACQGDFERDNVEKSIVLAEAAARAGARRMVFLSTVKVNGEETRGTPFRAGDPAQPSDDYGRSKWHAEQALHEVAARSGLPLVIVRAPLVIGPGAGGNLRALLNLCASRWPLPFGSIRNRRTLVPVDDLARLLARCAVASGIEGRTYLAGDPLGISTPALIETIRGAWSRPARLFACPAGVLESLAALAGQADRMRRLTRSLEVDVAQTLQELDWQPSCPLDRAITEMARAFRGEARA